jgi:hypothetical protein
MLPNFWHFVITFLYHSLCETAYYISGRMYTRTAISSGTPLSGDNIPQGKYGAWQLEIGADGNIDVVQASNNSTGYDSDSEAVLGLPAVSANHASMGSITAMKSDGEFQPGTTDLDDANTTVSYSDGRTMFNSIDAAVTSEAPETLMSNKPSSGPESLTADKPNAGPDTLSSSKPSSAPDSVSSSKPTALSAPVPNTLAS